MASTFSHSVIALFEHKGLPVQLGSSVLVREGTSEQLEEQLEEQVVEGKST